MTTRFFVAQSGEYIGGFSGVEPPGGSIEVPAPPENASHVWDFEGQQWIADAQKPPSSTDVNLERDRRIAAGFVYDGNLFDFDDRAKANISGAAQLAFMAIVAGAQPGDLFWNGGLSPFTWIAQDNSLVTMDPQTVVEFGRAAAEHEQSHIFAARALKDMEPIPDDFTDDSYWP